MARHDCICEFIVRPLYILYIAETYDVLYVVSFMYENYI